MEVNIISFPFRLRHLYYQCWECPSSCCCQWHIICSFVITIAEYADILLPYMLIFAWPCFYFLSSIPTRSYYELMQSLRGSIFISLVAVTGITNTLFCQLVHAEANMKALHKLRNSEFWKPFLSPAYGVHTLLPRVWMTKFVWYYRVCRCSDS